jgi:hypothetical protein
MFDGLNDEIRRHEDTSRRRRFRPSHHRCGPSEPSSAILTSWLRVRTPVF